MTKIINNIVFVLKIKTSDEKKKLKRIRQDKDEFSWGNRDFFKNKNSKPELKRVAPKRISVM